MAPAVALIALGGLATPSVRALVAGSAVAGAPLFKGIADQVRRLGSYPFSTEVTIRKVAESASGQVSSGRAAATLHRPARPPDGQNRQRRGSGAVTHHRVAAAAN